MSDDIDDFLAEIAGAQTDRRDPRDRFREFRAVFLATDEGRRVLYDILTWCHRYQSPVSRNPETGEAHVYNTFIKLGEHSVGHKILAAIHKQPRPDRPTSTRKSEGD